MNATTNQGPPSLGNAIALLLGRQASAGGPFALLGLTPDDCTQDLVIVQLQRQLARIAAHPMGTSAAADAVRAALHAAVAELLEGLDSQSPAEATAHVTSLTPGRSANLNAHTPAAPAAPRAPAPVLRTLPATVTPELAASARDILAEYGGWNPRSRQRLTFLAYSSGVRVNELLDAAQSVATTPTLTESTEPTPSPARPPNAPLAHASAPSSRPVGVTPDAGLYVHEDGTPKNQPFDEEIDPSRRLVKWLILGLAGTLATMLILAVVAYIMLKPPSTTNTTPAIAQSTPPSPATSTNSSAPSAELFPSPKTVTPSPDTLPTANPPSKPPAPAMPRDFADDLRDIAKCVTTATTDPDAALQAFDASSKSISTTWPTAKPDQLAAMQDIIVEFLYKVSTDPDRTLLVVDLLARGLRSAPVAPTVALTGDNVRAAAWSAGMIARVSRERELSSTISLRLQSVLAASPLAAWQGNETSFQSGAASALGVLARSLIPASTLPSASATSPASDAWSAWVASIDALKLAQRDRDRMVLSAIETLLTDAPEPSQSKPTFDAISFLITSLTWREADESRRGLLRWFERPAVSIADLHTLTSALASKSSAGGFDVSMVLAAGATEQERATLRDRLRQAWGLADGPQRTKLVSGWRESAEQELTQSAANASPNPHPLVEFHRAVFWSRLNESAGMILAGEPGSAFVDPSLDASVKSAIESLGQAAEPPSMLTAEPSWLVRYLGAGSNIAAKKQAFAEIYASMQFPKAVGEVLVSEVIRGSNSEIRKQATEIVRQHASDPAIVNGWLAQVSSMPIFQEFSDLVSAASLSKLPSIRSPSWRVAARRALVERLLQLLAGSGELTGVDNVSTLLAESYARRVATLSFNSRPEPAKQGESSDTPQPDPLTNLAPLETSARLYRQRLEHEAREKMPTGREPMSLTQIASRHESRSKIAAGRIQTFAAEQATSFELLAYIVAAEHPETVDQIAAIVDETNLARRQASHIATQLEAVERGMLRLWLLRLEGGKA